MKQLFGTTLDKLPVKSDAIVCLTGDGLRRVPKTAGLFKKKLADWVVVSGGYHNPPFSLLARYFKEALVKKGVPARRIILEEKSQNTLEQARETFKIIKKKKWQKIILVATDYHQLRAYLTFLKAMQEAGLKIMIFNAPAVLGQSELFKEESKKIREYSKKGHLATIKEAKNYQRWKEKQKL